jgi:hypothetical protein
MRPGKSPLSGAERRALWAERTKAKKNKPPKPPRVEQFPSAWGEDLPEPIQGIARVLSHGGPLNGQ